MKIWEFTEQPNHPVWDATKEPLKNILPNGHIDPRKAADLYDEYMEQWQICDEIGINIMVNEHHATATCMSASCTLPLAVLARTTKNVRMMSLGIPIANRTDPIRVAEEIAMIDTYSRGRFEMGFVRGAQYEVFPSSGDPVTQTRRFGEAYRLIMKALTTHDGPFSWNGEFYKCREVNIWPRCYQDPHPPVWMVAIGAAAGGWIAEQKAKVGTFLNGRASKALFDAYRRRWLELGWGMPSPDQFGYMAMAAVADTEEEARRRAYQIAGYVRTQGRLAPQFTNPPGYVPAKFVAKEMRLKEDPNYVAEHRTVQLSNGKRVILGQASIDELIDAHVVFAGTPDQVYKQIKAFHDHVGGVGNLMLMAQGGDLSHKDAVANLTMFSREVMPRLKELRVDGYEPPAVAQRAVA